MIGGLLVAAIVAAARARNISLVSFDTRLQAPLMIAFFKAGMPSAGVYLMSPELSNAVQLRMASMGALLFGSPPPR